VPFPTELNEPSLEDRRFVEHLDNAELSSVIEPSANHSRVIDGRVILGGRYLFEQTIDKEHLAAWL
jgi:hypothetical protein